MGTISIHSKGKITVHAKQPELILRESMSTEPVVKGFSPPNLLSMFSTTAINMINRKKFFDSFTTAGTFIAVSCNYRISDNLLASLSEFISMFRIFVIPFLTILSKLFSVVLEILSHVSNTISWIFVGHQKNPPRFNLTRGGLFVKGFISTDGYNYVSLKEI